jgi:hypothetical protein
MENKDINININPVNNNKEKKEPIHIKVANFAIDKISNAKWTKIFKVYFVMFFFLATGLIAFYAYNIVEDEEFINKSAQRIIESQDEENIRDFVVTPKIQHDIEVLLYTLNADRVFIFELHNGKKNTSGLPFRYADMSYECTNRERGVERCYKKFQDIPLTLYSYPEYMHKNTFFIGSTSELAEIDFEYAKTMKEEGGEYGAMIKLSGIETPLGFLGISFHKVEYAPSNEIIEMKLKSYGKTISELLDLQKQLKHEK